jgi:carboxyl-terminal processing protease
MVDMNSFMQMDNKKMGQLKMTIAKFYRISGGSTQHKGVIPDISFPSAFADAEFGEDASKFSLPYDEIKPADYSIVGNIKPALAELDAKHQERLKTNDEYKYLVEDIALIEKNRNKEYVTLNEDLYKKETKENEARNKERTEARKKSKDKNGENADLILDEAKLILSDYTSKK